MYLKNLVYVSVRVMSRKKNSPQMVLITRYRGNVQIYGKVKGTNKERWRLETDHSGWENRWRKGERREPILKDCRGQRMSPVWDEPSLVELGRHILTYLLHWRPASHPVFKPTEKPAQHQSKTWHAIPRGLEEDGGEVVGPPKSRSLSKCREKNLSRKSSFQSLKHPNELWLSSFKT